MDSRFLNKYILIRGLSLIAENIAIFIIPLAIYVETKDIRLSGLAYVVQWLPQVVLLPFLGIVVDKFSLPRQFPYLDGSRALLAATVPFLSGHFALMAMAGCFTLISSYTMITMEAFLKNYTPSHLVPAYQARMRAVYEGAAVFGPAAGGFLVLTASLQTLILAGSVGFLLCSIASYLLFRSVPRLEGEPLVRQRWRRELLLGFRIILGSGSLKRLIALTLCVNLVEGVCVAQLPAIVTATYGLSTAHVGAVASSAAFASILCLLICSHTALSTRTRQIAQVSAAMMAAGIFTIVIVQSFAPFAFGFMLWISGRSIFAVWMRAHRIKLIPSDGAGRALSVFIAAILLAAPISGATVYLVASKMGPITLIAYVAMTAATVAAVLLAIASLATKRPRET